MLTPLSALDAFRQDLGGGLSHATTSDARWLQLVTLLQSAADVPASARDGILEVAADLADPDVAADDRGRPPLPLSLRQPLPARVDLALRAIIAMGDAARFQLAYAAYDALLRALPSEIRDQGARAEAQAAILALQGRTARHLGDGAASMVCYRAVEAIGRERRDGAILARAWVGFGSLAQVRGNIPEARRWFLQTLAERDAVQESRQVAHHMLMVMAAGAGDYAAAAHHGWASYELTSTEHDAALALCDLSELMRHSGRPALALRGFSAALLRATARPRHLLPALGGAAMSAAEALPPESARPLVASFAERVEAVLASTNFPYVHASVLADLGDAFALLGDGDAAAAARARARDLAQGHGFFELLYRVTEGAVPVRKDLPARPVEQPMDAAEDVLRSIRSFAAPAEVERALASAAG